MNLLYCQHINQFTTKDVRGGGLLVWRFANQASLVNKRAIAHIWCCGKIMWKIKWEKETVKYYSPRPSFSLYFKSLSTHMYVCVCCRYYNKLCHIFRLKFPQLAKDDTGSFSIFVAFPSNLWIILIRVVFFFLLGFRVSREFINFLLLIILFVSYFWTC